MSEKKFNLKTYQKIDGSQHIDMRLNESRGNIPDVINEKQLESYRATEADVTIEKLLENNRTGEETEVTEKRLDTHKPKFANKYRNPAAHEGDMNKLEEQRLSGDPAEKEKYEAASQVGKQLRWWEGVKSPDGLKLASTEKKTTLAAKGDEDFDDPEDKVDEMKFDKPRWGEAEEEEDEGVTDTGIPKNLPKTPEDFEVVEETAPSGDPSFAMTVTKSRFLPNPNKPYLSGVYMVLSYDVDDLPPEVRGDEDKIKEAAYKKVVDVKPELARLISPEDFSGVNEEGGRGEIKLRVAGEQFADIAEKSGQEAPKSHAAPMADVPDIEEDPVLEEISFEDKDVAGTPMSIGRIGINTTVTEENKPQIVESIIAFVKKNHPGIFIEPESLDLTDISRGEVSFMVGTPMPELASEGMPNIEYNEYLTPEQNAEIQRERFMSAEEILDETERELEEAEKMPPDPDEIQMTDEELAKMQEDYIEGRGEFAEDKPPEVYEDEDIPVDVVTQSNAPSQIETAIPADALSLEMPKSEDKINPVASSDFDIVVEAVSKKN